MTMRELWTESRREPVIMFAAGALLIVILLAAIFPVVSGIDPNKSDIGNRLAAPSWIGGNGGLLGTDELGRDLALRILHGIRTSFAIGALAALLGAALGATLGLVSGYFGGRIDTFIMRVADIQLSFPGLLLVLVIVGALGRGILILVLLLGLLSWMQFARVVRSAVLSFRTTELVTATRGLGASHARTLILHILPNVAPILVALVTLRFAQVMLAEASLSFLGFGIQPPQISLGAILAQGRQLLLRAWWLSTFAGIFLTLGVLNTNLVGSWLYRKMDPLTSGGEFGLARKKEQLKTPPIDNLSLPAIPGEQLLAVRNLQILFDRPGRKRTTPIENVSFDIRSGERVGLVGESGSGKSLTALALMGLINRVGGRVSADSAVMFDGRNVLAMSESELRKVRGGRIGIIFQDPMTALNPVRTIGRHLTEALELHHPGQPKREYTKSALDLLEQVRLPRPDRAFAAYPHQLSGGMRQRAMMAIALAGDPDLLIADEPTTALDVTVQAEVLDLLYELCERRRLAVLLITHDLSIVAGFADRVIVMYSGRIVEESPTQELYSTPRHPYTAALLRSIPPLNKNSDFLVSIPGSPPEPQSRPEGCPYHPRCPFNDPSICAVARPPLRTFVTKADPNKEGAHACIRADELDLSTTYENPTIRRREQVNSLSRGQRPAQSLKGVVLSAKNLTKTYQTRGGRLLDQSTVTAIDNISLDIYSGESLGIVGESGGGKSTLARCLLRLTEPTSGSLKFRSDDLLSMDTRRLRRLRVQMQMIFQDPGSSLDPRMRVGRILSEPMRIHGLWGTEGNDVPRLRELLELVHLPPDSLERFPQHFSGGQQQRIAIARAIALNPTLLVCDEPVSALDVSVRSSILNLLAELRTELGLTLIFVAHDLSLVRFLCDRIAVMHRGRLVELGGRDELFSNPRHDHTRELMMAQPTPHPAEERGRRDARRRSRSRGATTRVS